VPEIKQWDEQNIRELVAVKAQTKNINHMLPQGKLYIAKKSTFPHHDLINNTLKAEKCSSILGRSWVQFPRSAKLTTNCSPMVEHTIYP
jgi:hypothetical protein